MTNECRVAIHCRKMDMNSDTRTMLLNVWCILVRTKCPTLRVALFTPTKAALKTVEQVIKVHELFVLPQDDIHKAIEIFDPHITFTHSIQ